MILSNQFKKVSRGEMFLNFVSGALHAYTEKQRYDGWYNNLAHPDWGSVGKYRQYYILLINYFYFL